MWASHRQRLKYETIRNDGKVKEEGARQCLERKEKEAVRFGVT
jgi:hypothetical protein